MKFFKINCEIKICEDILFIKSLGITILRKNCNEISSFSMKNNIGIIKYNSDLNSQELNKLELNIPNLLRDDIMTMFIMWFNRISN